MSPVKSGLLTIPLLAPICSSDCSLPVKLTNKFLVGFVVYITGWITSLTGHYRWMIVGGHALWCVAQGLQSTISLETSIGKIAGYLFLAGFSSAWTYQTYAHHLIEASGLADTYHLVVSSQSRPPFRAKRSQ